VWDFSLDTNGVDRSHVQSDDLPVRRPEGMLIVRDQLEQRERCLFQVNPRFWDKDWISRCTDEPGKFNSTVCMFQWNRADDWEKQFYFTFRWISSGLISTGIIVMTLLVFYFDSTFLILPGRYIVNSFVWKANYFILISHVLVWEHLYPNLINVLS
jgi:hypothetical protein